MPVLGPRTRTRLGPYELIERIGAGGMAEVWIARRPGPRGFSKRFAVKRILPQYARDPRFVEMFCDEARIHAALSHPNLVAVVDFGEHEGEVFMALEYVDGVSCARLLRHVAARGERIPRAAALYVVHEVLHGLAHAHEACDDEGRPLGIVHRDVSPGNVLIGRAGEVKLADFGVLRSAFIASRTYPGELKGKLGYLSPEQVIGGRVDARSDLFTVGIVLCEMLLTRPLFPGNDEFDLLTRLYEADLRVLDRHAGSLPPDHLELVRTALAREPGGRFQSAREFSEAVRTVARRAGYALDDTAIAPWLSTLGILPSRSGVREAAPRAPARRSKPPLAQPGGTPAAAARGTTAAASKERRFEASIDAVAEPKDGLEARASWRRPVERATLPETLFELVLGRETGVLCVREGRRTKRIWLASGSPCHATSSDREELLGARLERAGLLAPGDAERAVAHAARSGRRLGETLLALQALRPTELLRALIEQLDARFLELGHWARGELCFVRGEAAPPGALPRPSPLGLVVRLVREGYPDDEILGLVGRMRDVALCRARPEVCDALAPVLDDAEAVVLACAGGGSSIEQMASRFAAQGVATPRVLRALFIGLSAGALSAQPAARPA